MTIVHVDAGEGGRAYIRARLEGGLSLSRAVLASTDLDAGRVIALVSNDHPDHEAYAVGGGDRSQACDALRATLRGFFDDEPMAVLWVEEPLPKRSEILSQDPSSREGSWFLEEEVYSLVFASDDDSRLLSAINEIYDYPGWGGGGFVTTHRAAQRYREIHELDRESLLSAAQTTRAIACGAFDGQGYLLWIRPNDEVSLG